MLTKKYWRDRISLLPHALVILGSVLVCIWPMQHTIALRNSLLGLLCVLGLGYCWQFFRNSVSSFRASQFLPLVMLGLVLCWVVAHYFFLSQDVQAQYKEITSTWLRCALSLISGFSIGLAISTRPKWIWYLGVGLISSFIVLYAQYIPKVLDSHSLIQLDYSNYIFYAKHNVVLQGTLLLIMAFSAVLNYLTNLQSYKVLFSMIAAITFVLSAVLFAYVYMFDTRNGLGFAVILSGMTLIIFLLQLWHKSFGSKQVMRGALLLTLILGLVFLFGVRQAKTNLGWKYLLEDAQVAVQIDQYPNWINPQKRGYPILPSGRQVAVNTYERFAWATAAMRLIMQNPLGNGVLHSSFGRELLKRYTNEDIGMVLASHSAWLELGLAFGLPALFLSLGTIFVLIIRFYLAMASPFANLGMLMGFGLLLTYTFAELIGQHGLESLFYWAALLSGLLFWSPKANLNISVVDNE